MGCGWHCAVRGLPSQEAVRSGRQWAELTGAADPEEVMLLARVMEDPGLRPQALEILERWASAPVPRWPDIAFHYVLLDHPEEALSALEEGVRRQAPMMVQIGASPWVDPLRNEPVSSGSWRCWGWSDRGGRGIQPPSRLPEPQPEDQSGKPSRGSPGMSLRAFS